MRVVRNQPIESKSVFIIIFHKGTDSLRMIVRFSTLFIGSGLGLILIRARVER